MGEIIKFVSKSERERARLIREARAMYDSIFPPTNPVRDMIIQERVLSSPSLAQASTDA